MIMELVGNGLNKGSHMYFYTPSQNAKKILYYPIAVGNFYCNKDYAVSRNRYDSVLIIFVLNGSITLEQNGIYTARENEALIVDCYKPHKYYSNGEAHTLWVHFDGNNSREWLKETGLQKIRCNSKIADYILRIIDYVKNNGSEYDISSTLYSVNCKLSKPEGNIHNERIEQINRAKEYIESNFDRQIKVDDIAKSVNLSSSYFSKIFKEATNISPYDYMLSVRLERSKELLHKTDYSISEIAYKTGFNSDANFIYFFKKQTGISPLKFRKINF
ncbi:MAG: helix-turn-helix domain-containing protein [Eubacterium sp.]